VFGLSDKEARYLKAIKRLGRPQVRLIDLARELGASTPSALEEVRHLMAKGVVVNTRGHIALTAKGEEALEMLRRAHIALETILKRQGVGGEETCSEIHKFDYALPEHLAQRLYEAVGRPAVCPTGKAEC